MLKSTGRPVIRLRGVRHNNLKNFDLDLPLNQLVVITGLSGSGKSSLAFDTLFAEGQRRYIETFSPYARQFFDRMDKPQVDSIEGIPPAIAIEQRNAVKTTRSTVGTMTEICDHMKMLWPYIARLHCRQCGQLVRKDSPQSIWERICRTENVERGTSNVEHQESNIQRSTSNGEEAKAEGATATGVKEAVSELLVTFELALTEKLSLDECLVLVAKQGYQRLLLDDGTMVRLEEARGWLQPRGAGPRGARSPGPGFLTVIQDRLRPSAANRARFIEGCEQAYHFGKGKLTVWELERAGSKPQPRRFSNRFHCATCDIEYRPASPALFSFNHPVGACPKCRGFGRVISIDYDLALPDRSRTLGQGAVKPWQTGQGIECQNDLLRMCRHFEIPTDVPFEKLPKKWQDFVIEGDPNYGKDEEHEWPRAWYGIKGYFRWLESRAYKMHVRVLLSRYRAYTTCPDCNGQRFQPEALWYRVDAANFQHRTSNIEHPTSNLESRRSTGARSLTLADFYQLPVRDALRFVETLAGEHRIRPNDPLGLVLNEVRSRLGYLNDVGLGYLTLERPTRSLSGGETERVNLTTCLGTRLVNTLFVLDEPSVGLHPRDTERLVRILQQLRAAGNTVVVVEHEPGVMRAADQLIDLGPGHGATGGQIVFQGTFEEILKARDSLTGQYLSGVKCIELPARRAVERRVVEPERALAGAQEGRSRFEPLVLKDSPKLLGQSGDGLGWLTITHATRHNLRDLAVSIPLGRFVCVTGVSGSGKTTLVREVLLPALGAQLKSEPGDVKASDRLSAEDNGSEDSGGESESAPAGNRSGCRVEGSENLGRVVLVDQTLLGKTPRSNPAVYIGAFDDVREVFADCEPARQRGLNASAFSFNSAQGQCERCRGAGFEKIEMQFLSDIFIRCPDCQGRRYRSHILDVKIGKPRDSNNEGQKERDKEESKLNIADLLESTVDEAVDFLSGFSDSRPARRAVASLKLLQEVGLGYLKLGQPINTLSGGESQRLKLVRELSEAERTAPARDGGIAREKTSREFTSRMNGSRPAAQVRPTLFLFDEPTTGLHFDDVRLLLKVFQRLVQAGHSVIVIEHNLDVIKSADWVIDLGPDAGDEGGQVVSQGTPETIAECTESHTGKALRPLLVEG